MQTDTNHNLKTAVFAGGCFWCTEAVFQKLRGVFEVLPGYTGGRTENPSYEEVTTGTTNHAEAIQFSYDPEQISFKDLLTVFFATHDPTSLNRQGGDVGTQYRSAIFYSSEEEKQEAENFINDLSAQGVFAGSIVTTLEPLKKFYEAEDYHKNYYEKNSGVGYCQVIIGPKIAKLREQFSQLLTE